MKRCGNFLRHIGKNIKGMNVQGMCVYQEKEEERKRKTKFKTLRKIITMVKRGLRECEVSCYGLCG